MQPSQLQPMTSATGGQPCDSGHCVYQGDLNARHPPMITSEASNFGTRVVENTLCRECKRLSPQGYGLYRCNKPECKDYIICYNCYGANVHHKHKHQTSLIYLPPGHIV